MKIEYAALKKIVLRIFYIEYFSKFGGDFAPIELRNAWLLAVLLGCYTKKVSQVSCCRILESQPIEFMILFCQI
jgi:hypothetical protein